MEVKYPLGKNHSPLNLSIHKEVLTGNFSLIDEEIDEFILVNTAGACEITIPIDDDLHSDLGLEIHILQKGAGSLSLSPAIGVTAVDPHNLASPKFLRLKKTAANEWTVVLSQ
jgi:hypothetical protein